MNSKKRQRLSDSDQSVEQEQPEAAPAEGTAPDDDVDEEEEVEEEYDVERIVAWRYRKDEQMREYCVKWTGWSEEDNTWEPEEHLNCEEKLEKFKQKLSDKEKRWLEAPDPRQLTGFQRNATVDKLVGVEGPRSDRDNQPFYILLKFDDSEAIEEISLLEFYKHRPQEAFEFCEKRLLATSAVI